MIVRKVDILFPSFFGVDDVYSHFLFLNGIGVGRIILETRTVYNGIPTMFNVRLDAGMIRRKISLFQSNI